ncbi:proline-rich protein 2-like [Pezoporus wallicus]|uniref:proline-rich protein 2-like n=1 Tax=Pezoporus wallicus TaxID=35540 RepID=UPI002549D8C8|nr:proline-rich protein 2-like [Pezoporus wallicus]
MTKIMLGEKPTQGEAAPGGTFAIPSHTDAVPRSRGTPVPLPWEAGGDRAHARARPRHPTNPLSVGSPSSRRAAPGTTSPPPRPATQTPSCPRLQHPPPAGSVPGSCPAPPASGSWGGEQRGSGLLRSLSQGMLPPGPVPAGRIRPRSQPSPAPAPRCAPAPQPGPHRPAALPVPVPTCAAPPPSPSAAAAAAEPRCRGGGQRESGGGGGQRPLPAPGLPPAPPVRPARPGPGPQPLQRRQQLPPLRSSPGPALPCAPP